LKGNDRVLIQALSQNLPGQTEEIHGKPYGSQCLRRDLNQALA